MRAAEIFCNVVTPSSRSCLKSVKTEDGPGDNIMRVGGWTSSHRRMIRSWSSSSSCITRPRRASRISVQARGFPGGCSMLFLLATASPVTRPPQTADVANLRTALVPSIPVEVIPTLPPGPCEPEAALTEPEPFFANYLCTFLSTLSFLPVVCAMLTVPLASSE